MNGGNGADTPQRIRIFVTGGTFDKEYDELRGTLYFKQTHLRPRCCSSGAAGWTSRSRRS